MSKKEKLWDKIKTNPIGRRLSEIETVAKREGCEVIWGGRGSHLRIRHPLVPLKRLTVKASKPVKPEYVVAFVDFIEELREEKAQRGEE